MQNKLSALPAPALAGVVKEKTVRGANAAIRNCRLDGADMIDLHLSCLENTDVETIARIVKASALPILALHYNDTYDRQPAGVPEEARVACLLRAVKAGVAGIDMQGYTFDPQSKDGFRGEDQYSFTKDAPKEVVTDGAVIAKQCELIEKVHALGAEVLLSCHPGVAMRAEQVVELALFLERRKPDIIKIVTTAKTEEELTESFAAMTALKKAVRTPVAYHVSGKAGRLSRIVNPLLGGQIAFCVDRYDERSTMEQLDLHSARVTVDAVRRMI
ncbi:MAG: type I 3-dehydroquinate dehydratase [Oscillospiraceae bacterium]|nr:type I 3-dehydroquinate dehydratase [Oscillospiraceae bacterium]